MKGITIKYIHYLNVMRYDAAIVGAGAAGSMVAYLLARKGYRIIVLEKNRAVGGKVCGGLVSERVIRLSGTEAVTNEIRGADVVFPDGRCVRIGGDRTHAYVIDRSAFDRELAERAEAEGATFRMGVRVAHMSPHRITGNIDVSYDVLIGADGAQSTVARRFDMGNVSSINTIQGEIPASGDDRFARIYLDTRISPGFFSWCIPDGEKTRVGLGSTERGLRRRLDAFAAKLSTDVHRARGALIPVGMRALWKENVVLVGDAAGQVKATSGGGLYPLLCAAHLLAGHFGDGAGYQREFMRGFGRELKRALWARRIFEKLSNDDFIYLGRYVEEEAELIARHGDIDYQSRVAMAFIKRHPSLVWHVLLRCVGQTFFSTDLL